MRRHEEHAVEILRDEIKLECFTAIVQNIHGFHGLVRFRQCLEEYSDKYQAVIEAACQRFRAVLLTSITTVIGLLPLLFERSIEAQIVKTMVVLVITPSLMMLARQPRQAQAAVPENEPVAVDSIDSATPMLQQVSLKAAS